MCIPRRLRAAGLSLRGILEHIGSALSFLLTPSQGGELSLRNVL